MPSAARRPCTWAGCPALVEQGHGSRCEKHAVKARQAQDRERGTAHERGYTGAWQKARIAYLSAHPLCAEHTRQGRVMPASVVDHIKPHKGDKTLFWDSANWQPLCKACHDRKTATEDGGWGKA